MLYQRQLSKGQMVQLIEMHYSDIYPVCREQVFMAKLEDEPFPTVTASLLPGDWDDLVDEYATFEEDALQDTNNIYEGKEVVWFTEYSDPDCPITDDCLNIFFYRDTYKELK